MFTIVDAHSMEFAIRMQWFKFTAKYSLLESCSFAKILFFAIIHLLLLLLKFEWFQKIFLRYLKFKHY